MVPRAAWEKIVLAALAAVLIVGGIAIQFHKEAVSVSKPVYSASTEGLDVAVAEGISKADRDPIPVSGGKTRAVIVPHHLVASEAIAIGVKALASSSPRTIIVISPDHFGRCPTLVCTTEGTYHTHFGDTAISEEDIAKLLSHASLVSSSRLFTDEHGVYTIVPFIKYYLPDAKIVPIAVSQRSVGDEKSRNELLALLRELLSEQDVGLIISSDFSHYLPLAQANAMDEKTQASFCEGKSDEILRLKNPSQSDCPLCLWVLEQEAETGGFWHPAIAWHSNSATLLGDTSAKSTTSHFSFLLGEEASVNDCSAHDAVSVSASAATSTAPAILAVGDMFFDRYIRQVADKRGPDYLFSCINPLLRSGDFVVGNLEGPITTSPSTSEGTVIGSPQNYGFTFPTTTAALLFEHNVRVVNLGNNHIDNQGLSGISSTRTWLRSAGVGYFGGLAGGSSVYRTEDKGLKLSFVSYNQFGGDAPPLVASTIANERSAGRTVIVYAHWGTEYSEDVTALRPIAELFATSGAAVIIGSHPHIVLPHEYIASTLVYYSLGNFIFDQYFDPRVTQGLALLLAFDNGKVTAKEYPVVLDTDGRTCPFKS
ncbi:MAG: AmmeMemoRadiSam system protein B [Patescibacteria group bacterium]|nr:AmmeMemoRadiSam system protein B [Patescibacteria group bacterium]